MNLFSGKRFLFLGFFIVLLVAIPLTVLTLEKTQESRIRATPATTLTFDPPTVSTQVGETFTLDIVVNPGTNQISFAKFTINYDSGKLEPVDEGIELITPTGLEGQGFTSVLEGPTVSEGTIVLTASVGTDPQRAIQTTTKVAKLTFKAIAETGGTASRVSFADKPQTQLLSLAGADEVSENVLLGSTPAQVSIGAGVAPTPTAGPTSTPGTNKPPVCSNLNIDRTPSGVVPFSIAFTANGRDEDGTISKVTFDFGDGPVQDVTQDGGIGSNSVSVQTSHTYNNAGTFKAKAIITDNNNAISVANSSCEQTITVTGGPTVTPGAIGGEDPSATPTATLEPTPTEIPTQTPVPTIADPGPAENLIGIAAIGTILTILGAIVFFAL